jgi:hypothetical protein
MTTTPPSEKTCRKCGEPKPLEAFYRDSAKPGGLATVCKGCTRAYNSARYSANKERIRAKVTERKRREPSKVRLEGRRHKLKHLYGITVEEYEALLRSQAYVCALCEQGCRSGNRLSIDHCHATGRVRQLLCGTCNRGLGLLKDDPSLLRRAADYVERHALSAS